MVLIKSHSGSSMLHGFLRVVLLFCFYAAFAVTIRSADDPATLLKRDFGSAKSALSEGDLSKAERHYTQAIALGLRQLGNLSVSESNFDQAARELDQAMKFAPGDPDIAVDGAVAWFRAADVKKARQLAQTVAADYPRHARAQNVLGRIDLYRGDFDAAVRDLQASVALEADFESSYFLGIAYLKAKRLADAQHWFQRLQAATGDSAALHVLFGRAYTIAHFPEPAVVEFRKAVQLDPK
jgi:tetratricopeptide (TPR) repeat protein